MSSCGEKKKGRPVKKTLRHRKKKKKGKKNRSRPKQTGSAWHSKKKKKAHCKQQKERENRAGRPFLGDRLKTPLHLLIYEKEEK